MAQQIPSHVQPPCRDMRESSQTSTAALARDATSPSLELRNTNLSTFTMNEDCRQHIQSQCERYGRYTAFLGKSPPSDQALRSAGSVRDTVSEIDQILIEAERAIQEKMSKLRKAVDQFETDVAKFSDARWYRNIEDLTAYENAKFNDMIRNMPVRDYNDFAAYLKERLPSASEKTRPDHEYSGRTFVGKSHTLLERVLSFASYSASFSLFAIVKAKVFLLDRPRVPSRGLENELAHVDSQLLWLMDVHSEVAERDEYWDFPAVWRVLVYAWEDIASDSGSLLRLLGPVRKKAEREIRYRTEVAVNGKLPQELADLVFEQAMTVEEVPLEPE